MRKSGQVIHDDNMKEKEEVQLQEEEEEERAEEEEEKYNETVNADWDVFCIVTVLRSLC